jgi:hypothetical protein
LELLEEKLVWRFPQVPVSLHETPESKKAKERSA